MPAKDSNHARDYEIKKAVYNGDYYHYFNAQEFDAKVHPYDYVTTDAFRTCVSIIVDLVKVGEIEVDFGDEQINEEVNNTAKEGHFTARLEKLVENMKVYGSSYIEIVKDEEGFKLYNKQSKLVRAIYNEDNPQAEPEGYILEIEKEINDRKYTLVVTYTVGQILYEAYLNYAEQGQRAVNPLEFFEHLIPTASTKEGNGYILETQLKYNTLEGVQYNVPDGEFYGQGDLTYPILSKLNYYNRLVNMSDTIYTYNAFPKFQASMEVGNLLNQAKEETRQEINENLNAPTSFAGVPARVNNFLNTASYAFSVTMRKMRDKLIIFPTNGRGENKYIINEYNMDFIKRERESILNQIKDELFISKLLYSTDISTGQMTGIAIKRLMQTTLNHVEDIQDMIEPVIQRLYYLVAEAKLSYTGPLPSVKFAGITMQDVRNTIDNIAIAGNIADPELRAEAVGYALDITTEQAKERLDVGDLDRFEARLQNTTNNLINSINGRGNNQS